MIKVVIFDWGDTVMRMMAGCTGPMAHWPSVEAVPGVEGALRALKRGRQLVLATNAHDSGTKLVRQALGRVGLEGYFHHLFTARDLGAAKPDPRFFQAMLAQVGCWPEDVAMVGDDYQADVAGARAAGLRAVWFNETGAPCPGAHPLHDAEIGAMDELPQALGQLYLPDVAECMALLVEHDVPARTVAHSQAVAAVAYRLASRLRRRGEPVEPLLTHRGGLLHDLDKASSRRLGREHGELGAEILKEMGHGRLSDIVRRHVIWAIVDPEVRPTTWEEKLVYYADKAVEGDEFAGVGARFQSLYRRIPAEAEAFRRCLPAVQALEAEICTGLGMTVEEVYDALKGQEAAWVLDPPDRAGASPDHSVHRVK